jgi:hypothetical protein
MTTAAATLARQIDDIIEMVEDARAFEHERGLGSIHTRKLPANAIRELRRWQSVTASAAGRDTVHDKSGATAPQGQPTAGDSKSTSSARSPQVQAPVVSIRMSPDLREQAEAFGRERRWTLAQTTRVALEQLVGQGDDTHGHEPRQAA